MMPVPKSTAAHRSRCGRGSKLRDSDAAATDTRNMLPRAAQASCEIHSSTPASVSTSTKGRRAQRLSTGQLSCPATTQ